MTERLRNSYKLETLTGSSLPGLYNARRLRTFVPREGSQLHTNQQEHIHRLHERDEGEGNEEEGDEEEGDEEGRRVLVDEETDQQEDTRVEGDHDRGPEEDDQARLEGDEEE